jgi:hypothetical protein
MAAAATASPAEAALDWDAMFAAADGGNGVHVVGPARAMPSVTAVLGQRGIRVASSRPALTAADEDVKAAAEGSKTTRELAIVVAVDCLVPREVEAAAAAADVSVVSERSDRLVALGAAVSKAVTRRRRERDCVTWLPVAGSLSMALWHRPTRSQLADRRAEGCTHVVSLLSARERPDEIGSWCRALGMTWLPLTMDGAHVTRLAAARHGLLAHVAAVAQLAKAEAPVRLLVHCAAGIHRTGVFGYLLLRTLGRDPAAALADLFRVRLATGRGVGRNRLELAEALFGGSVPADVSAALADEEDIVDVRVEEPEET